MTNITMATSDNSTPVNPAMFKAMAAYGAVAESKDLPTEVVWAKLLRGILNNLKRAQREYEAQRLDKMCDVNGKTMDVLSILTQSLEVDEADYGKLDIAGAIYFISGVYRDTMMGLVCILSAEDTSAEFIRLQDNFRPLVERIEAIAGITTPANQAAEEASADAIQAISITQ